MQNATHNAINGSTVTKRKRAIQPVYNIDTIAFKGVNVVLDYTLGKEYLSTQINFTTLVEFAESYYGDKTIKKPGNYDFIVNLMENLYEIVELYLIENKIGQVAPPSQLVN